MLILNSVLSPVIWRYLCSVVYLCNVVCLSDAMRYDAVRSLTVPVNEKSYPPLRTPISVYPLRPSFSAAIPRSSLQFTPLLMTQEPPPLLSPPPEHRQPILPAPLPRQEPMLSLSFPLGRLVFLSVRRVSSDLLEDWRECWSLSGCGGCLCAREEGCWADGTC
jgi:hypothetical protein